MPSPDERAYKQEDKDKSPALLALEQELRSLAVDHKTLHERMRVQTTKDSIQALYQDVNVLHVALNDLLALFIQACGRDYSCVDKALDALARHPELPTTVALAEMKPASREEVLAVWKRLKITSIGPELIVYDADIDFLAGTITLTPRVEGKGQPAVWPLAQEKDFFRSFGAYTFKILETKYSDGTGWKEAE